MRLVSTLYSTPPGDLGTKQIYHNLLICQVLAPRSGATCVYICTSSNEPTGSCRTFIKYVWLSVTSGQQLFSFELYHHHYCIYINQLAADIFSWRPFNLLVIQVVNNVHWSLVMLTQLSENLNYNSLLNINITCSICLS